MQIVADVKGKPFASSQAPVEDILQRAPITPNRPEGARRFSSPPPLRTEGIKRYRAAKRCSPDPEEATGEALTSATIGGQT